jgi:hypothetical protein
MSQPSLEMSELFVNHTFKIGFVLSFLAPILTGLMHWYLGLDFHPVAAIVIWFLAVLWNCAITLYLIFHRVTLLPS